MDHGVKINGSYPRSYKKPETSFDKEFNGVIVKFLRAFVTYSEIIVKNKMARSWTTVYIRTYVTVY